MLPWFEWDTTKNTLNVEKHGFTFEDAKSIFLAPLYLIHSPRHHEERFIAIGRIKNRMAAVVFTRRRDKIRIISVRGARKNEKAAYEAFIQNS